MTDLLAARSQMAMSLGFHMVFATIGIGMPLLMVLAEGLWLRTGDPVWRTLAQRWAKGTAVMFAVGAVSGTVLSFELGLLWPGFMELAGPIIGMPFSLEGFAFFLEAIFLGVYLYGWDRVSPIAHWLAGVGVLVSGTMSGVFVVSANAWMNSPTGFTLDEDGYVTSIDPLAAMLNPHFFGQALHMTVAAFLATSFVVLGVHAWMLRNDRHNRFHRCAFGLALAVGAVTAGLQPLTGHVVGEAVAHGQPVKLAAMEAHFHTEQGAAFIIGGWPDEQTMQTHYAIRIPKLLSFLAMGSFDAEIKGLADYPREDWPPVAVTHVAYQIMLASAGVMGITGLIGVVLVVWRRRLPLETPFLWLAIFASPWGMIGIEAGWTATEVGRQPWVIQGVMRTADAVTPMPGLVVPFMTFSLLYLVLGVMVIALLRRQFLHSPHVELDPAEVTDART